MQFDLVVPCYNYGRFLRQCVESVLQQEGVDVRVLIIDDCSPDDTPDIGRALAAEDLRVEYRRHATNLRHIATYNEGFQWVAGDAMLLLSADDLLTAGALRRVADVFTQHPEVDLVWGSQSVFDQVLPPPVQLATACSYRVLSGVEFIQQMCVSGSNPVMTPTAVVRASMVKAIGGYDYSLPHTADMHYWLRCAARASIAIVEAQQAYKRMHGENMQVEFVSRRVRDLDQQWRAFESFFNHDGQRLARADELRRLAQRSIANQAFWAASDAFEHGIGSQCDELLTFARGLDRDLPASSAWGRLSIKRRLGRRLWRTFSPFLDRIRSHIGPSVARLNA
jgi:hypothetical protein